MAIEKTNFYTQSLNQLTPHRLRGEYLDWGLNAEVMEVMVDESQATEIFPGDALTIVSTSTGKLKVKAAAAGDLVFGFALYNPKYMSWKAGQILSCLRDGGVIMCVTEKAVEAGAKVKYDPTDGSIDLGSAGDACGIAMAAVSATTGGTLIPVLVQKPAL